MQPSEHEGLALLSLQNNGCAFGAVPSTYVALAAVLLYVAPYKRLSSSAGEFVFIALSVVTCCSHKISSFPMS